MSDISVPSYMPCYHIDLSTKKATLGKYNFSKFLEQQTQLAENARNQATSSRQLTQQQYQELAGKYDPEQMSQQEYRDFIHELENNGILSSDEAFELIANCSVVRPGAYGQIETSPAFVAQKSSSIRSLADADGNVIYWLSIMAQNWNGNSTTKVITINRVNNILTEISKYR